MDLKEDQYLDSGDFEGVLDLGFSFGFIGKIAFCCWFCSGSAIEGVEVAK